MSSNPAQIEVTLRYDPRCCLVKARASNFGLGPIASNHVRGQVERFLGTLKAVLDSWAPVQTAQPGAGPQAAAVTANGWPVPPVRPMSRGEMLLIDLLMRRTENWTTPSGHPPIRSWWAWPSSRQRRVEHPGGPRLPWCRPDQYRRPRQPRPARAHRWARSPLWREPLEGSHHHHLRENSAR